MFNLTEGSFKQLSKATGPPLEGDINEKAQRESSGVA